MFCCCCSPPTSFLFDLPFLFLFFLSLLLLIPLLLLYLLPFFIFFYLYFFYFFLFLLLLLLVFFFFFSPLSLLLLCYFFVLFSFLIIFLLLLLLPLLLFFFFFSSFSCSSSTSYSCFSYKFVSSSSKVKGRDALSTPLLSGSDYSILKDNSQAHVVKIDRGLRSDTTSAFGYAIFGNAVVVNSVDSDRTRFMDATKGPIKRVSARSILMAQYDRSHGLALSISSPDLNLRRDPNAPRWCPSTRDWPRRPVKNNDVGEEYEFCAASKAVTVSVTLIHSNFTIRPSYFVNSEERLLDTDVSVSGDTIEFTLRNGFTTEIRLNEQNPLAA